jgi:hypothetical protein
MKFNEVGIVVVGSVFFDGLVEQDDERARKEKDLCTKTTITQFLNPSGEHLAPGSIGDGTCWTTNAPPKDQVRVVPI